jgi:hypothetical protein
MDCTNPGLPVVRELCWNSVVRTCRTHKSSVGLNRCCNQIAECSVQHHRYVVLDSNWNPKHWSIELKWREFPIQIKKKRSFCVYIFLDFVSSGSIALHRLYPFSPQSFLCGLNFSDDKLSEVPVWCLRDCWPFRRNYLFWWSRSS